MFGSIGSMKVLKHEQKLKQDFPEQPWRWKTIWSTDTIPDTSQTWQRPLDLYSLWSAFIVVPLILTSAMIGAFAQTWHSWLLTIFVALWFIPASATWRGIKKRLVLGASRLHIDKPFVEPGNVVNGEIEFGREVRFPEPPTIHSICEKTEFDVATSIA